MKGQLKREFLRAEMELQIERFAKIYYTYPTMMKLVTAIPNLKNIPKIYVMRCSI